MTKKRRIPRALLLLLLLVFSLLSLALEPAHAGWPQAAVTLTPEEISLGQDFAPAAAAASSDGMLLWAVVLLLVILLPLGMHLRQLHS